MSNQNLEEKKKKITIILVLIVLIILAIVIVNIVKAAQNKETSSDNQPSTVTTEDANVLARLLGMQIKNSKQFEIELSKQDKPLTKEDLTILINDEEIGYTIKKLANGNYEVTLEKELQEKDKIKILAKGDFEGTLEREYVSEDGNEPEPTSTPSAQATKKPSTPATKKPSAQATKAPEVTTEQSVEATETTITTTAPVVQETEAPTVQADKYTYSVALINNDEFTPSRVVYVYKNGAKITNVTALYNSSNQIIGKYKAELGGVAIDKTDASSIAKVKLSDGTMKDMN